MTEVERAHMFELYTTARDAWMVASRFTTSRALGLANAADKAFTDALFETGTQ